MRERFAEYEGQKCSIQNSGGSITDPLVHIMRNEHYPNNGWGISADPEYLVTGSNSGAQALNLAALTRPRKIILIAYDGKPGEDGKSHWFGEHPVMTQPGAYGFFVQSFKEASAPLRKMGIRVINASPNTAIQSFDRMTLDEALRI